MRVSRPSIDTSSISNFAPGAVSAARACANDRAGHSGGSWIRGSLAKELSLRSKNGFVLTR
jgi:hypothetical protein